MRRPMPWAAPVITATRGFVMPDTVPGAWFDRGVRIVVVGGGIAGLAAAAKVRQLAGAGVEIVIVEQADALGGKLRTGQVAGGPTERGAELFLTSAPVGPDAFTDTGGVVGDSAATALARRVGLGAALRHPTA